MLRHLAFAAAFSALAAAVVATSGCSTAPQTRPESQTSSRDSNNEPDTIAASLNDHRDDFLGCYRREILVGHGEGGKMLAWFTIESQGEVGKVESKPITLKDPELESCVIDIIRQIRFPAPVTGHLEVSYPFNFHSG